MLILLTNDDGIHAEGLAALESSFRARFNGAARVVTVAPSFPSSGVSRALTFNRPLRAAAAGEHRHELDGTPVDCVQWAMKHLLKEDEVTLVVSGINHGPNLGDDIAYSGTVGAALEGARLGAQALAVSLVMVKSSGADFAPAAEIAARLAARIIDRPLPNGVALSANIPQSPFKGFKPARPGRRIYSERVEERKDPFGRSYFWMAGDGTLSGIAEDGTDLAAVQAGYVSLSALDSELHAPYTELETWANI